MSKIVTREELMSCLSYDPRSGEFRWRITLSNRRRAGDVAGCATKLGYVLIGIHGRLYKAHRLAWLYVHGTWPKKMHLDHINGNKADNRIENLREASASQNGANSAVPKSNTTGIKGVYYDKRYGTWYSRIKVNRRSIHLGTFNSTDDARRAYLSAAHKYFGDFSRSE